MRELGSVRVHAYLCLHMNGARTYFGGWVPKMSGLSLAMAARES